MDFISKVNRRSETRSVCYRVKEIANEAAADRNLLQFILRVRSRVHFR